LPPAEPPSSVLSSVLSALLAERSYREGTFTLASGKHSDFYVDVKQTVFTARGAAVVGRLLLERLRAHSIACVGGMAIGAVPLVAAVLVQAEREHYPLEGFFVRRQVKEHGTEKKIDGCLDPRARIALLEDVVTTGASTIEAIEQVEATGGKVSLVVAVVDREEDDGLARLAERAGSAEALASKTSVREAYRARG